jgi:signal transduction histidine kinase
VTPTEAVAAPTGSPSQPESHRRSLRKRLTLLFTAGSLVLALVIVVSALSLVHLVDSRRTLLQQVDPASLSADQLLLSYVDQETGIRGFVLGRNPAFLQPTTSGLITQKAEEPQLARTLAHDPMILGLVHQAERQASTWQREFARPAIRSARSGNDAYASEAAETRGKDLFDEIRTRFATLDEALGTARANAGNELNQATEQLVLVLAFGIVFLIAAGIGLQLALRNWVTRPLSVLGAESRLVARGELSHRIVPTGPTEIAELGGDVEGMRQRIVDELHEVATAHEDLDARNIELARSNRELEQFAYVASHDLQEPLRKVISFVQLLEQRYDGQLDARASQYIGFAVDGATRMQRLINDLLSFSRVGRTTESFAQVSMRVCVVAAVENLEAVIDETGGIVEYADLPAVTGDQTLLTSLWQNLIGNSIKFRSDQAPCITLDAVEDSHEVVFSITDNGIGIEPRFSEKIFVIFQRLHGRDSYEGTGIGLAMCKKIVEFHGGRMWLDTAPRAGCRICFSLPVASSNGSA